jgi:hypothetical protein
MIVARMKRTLKAAAAGLKEWTLLDAHYGAASFHLRLNGWSKERRFVVIRELERGDKSVVCRKLIEALGYTYPIFASCRPTALTCYAGSLRLAVSLRSAVTNRNEDAVTL